MVISLKEEGREMRSQTQYTVLNGQVFHLHTDSGY